MSRVHRKFDASILEYGPGPILARCAPASSRMRGEEGPIVAIQPLGSEGVAFRPVRTSTDAKIVALPDLQVRMPVDETGRRPESFFWVLSGSIEYGYVVPTMGCVAGFPYAGAAGRTV